MVLHLILDAPPKTHVIVGRPDTGLEANVQRAAGTLQLGSHNAVSSCHVVVSFGLSIRVDSFGQLFISARFLSSRIHSRKERGRATVC